MSRICGEIDEHVAVFRTRSLEHLAPRHVFVDATYVKARIEHHIVSRAVIVATAVAADGKRAKCWATWSAPPAWLGSPE